MPDRRRTPEEKYRAGIIEDIRPWGKFRRYPHKEAGSIKIITVDPGGILSLQAHRKRGECWVVLDDGLEVTLGKHVWRPKAGDEILVPAGEPHRLANPGPSPARVMEIWIGASDEDDIVRFEDAYGRLKKRAP